MVFDTTPEERELVFRELGEDPSQMQADVDIILEWLARQPHLPSEMDREFIATYIRACKYSLEKVKQKLEMYFTVKAALPEFFSNTDPISPEVVPYFQYGYFTPLARLTPQGYRVLLLGFNYCEASKLDVDLFAKAIFTVDDVLTYKGGVTSGIVLILEPNGFSVEHFLKAPVQWKKFLTCIQDAYPNMVKQIHIIRTHPFIAKLLSLIKPFLKQKLVNRIHFHGDDLKNLYNYVQREQLPNEMGGDAGTLSQLYADWRRYLTVEMRQWVVGMESKKAIEALRTGKAVTHGELFGVEGTFRQLTVD